MKKLVKPTVKSNAVPNSLGKCMCSSFRFGNPLESNYKASTTASQNVNKTVAME